MSNENEVTKDDIVDIANGIKDKISGLSTKAKWAIGSALGACVLLYAVGGSASVEDPGLEVIVKPNPWGYRTHSLISAENIGEFDLKITKFIVNRGKSCTPVREHWKEGELADGAQDYSYGETAYFAVACEQSKVREVEIFTNLGTFTYHFK